MSTLAALREATQAQHRALEASPLPARIMSPGVTLCDYGAFLRAQAAVLAAWTRECPVAIRAAGGCRPEARLAALQADLAGWLPAPSVEITAARDGDNDMPSWWGAYYVVEGARLGARVVARHLRARLSGAVDGRLAFLEFDGDAPWPHAIQAIETAVPPAARDGAVAGARRQFAHYRDAFAAVERSSPTA